MYVKTKYLQAVSPVPKISEALITAKDHSDAFYFFKIIKNFLIKIKI
jgi:hypothetical protein